MILIGVTVKAALLQVACQLPLPTVGRQYLDLFAATAEQPRRGGPRTADRARQVGQWVPGDGIGRRLQALREARS